MELKTKFEIGQIVKKVIHEYTHIKCEVCRNNIDYANNPDKYFRDAVICDIEIRISDDKTFIQYRTLELTEPAREYLAKIRNNGYTMSGGEKYTIGIILHDLINAYRCSNQKCYENELFENEDLDKQNELLAIGK